MKNKLFVLALLIPMVLSGCGSQKESSSSVSEPSSFSSETSSTNSSSNSISSASASSSSSSAQSSSSAETTSHEPAPTIPNYVLHGLFSDSLDWTDKAMTRNPSSSTEYMIIGVTLNRNDVFKIHMDGDNWYGFSAIKKYAGIPSGLVEQAEDYDNIKVLTSGTYDIYCNKNASDGGNIYLARTDDSGDDPDPTPGVVKVTGVSLNRSGKMLQPRYDGFQLTATVSPSNATNQDVTWTSSDESIATVTTAGRIIAKSKTGTTTITVKTADGNKTAQCVIYVKTNGIPDYYLTGTINGSLVSSGTYTRYPAIPLSGGSYLIADVDLQSGDKLNVRGENGKSSLLDRYNHLYEYQVKKAASVNIILSPNDSSYNYLTLKEK